MTLEHQRLLAMRAIKSGIDSARALGVVCDYPDFVDIDGAMYSFASSLEALEAYCAKDAVQLSRVITRVMDDGVKTKDSCA